MRLRYRRPDAPRFPRTTPEMDLDRSPGALGTPQGTRGGAGRCVRRDLAAARTEAQDHRPDYHRRDVPGDGRFDLRLARRSLAAPLLQPAVRGGVPGRPCAAQL